jgi:hypothetical protein
VFPLQNAFKITGKLHSVKMSDHLDRLARSSDPYLRKRLEDELKPVIRSSGQPFMFNITDAELTQYTRKYGEQFVADPCGDLKQYFDVVNGRLFSRSVPTQLAVLYLFGTGRQYRPNVGALSASGEAVAGYCIEKFGYKPLVRPLGVMPDAVAWTKRNGVQLLALVEAKASTGQTPDRMIEQNVSEFFVDIKTRASGFRYKYEAYLVCSLFKDGCEVECAILHVDLGHYCSGSISGSGPDISVEVPAYTDPTERLRAIIRLQAECASSRDQYLAELLSEEATRSATLALIKQGRDIKNSAEVKRYINETASELGLAKEWQEAQDLVRETKGKEEEILKLAIERYRKPNVDL